MRYLRLLVGVSVLVLCGGVLLAEDADVEALRAMLAEHKAALQRQEGMLMTQSAQLNDLRAKMAAPAASGSANDVVSLRKNAKIVIGGDYNVRMFRYEGKVKSSLDPADLTQQAASKRTLARVKATDFTLNDAKIRILADVSEHFEAFFRLDMQAGDGDQGWRQVQDAYIRWKNICDSGFSLLVGRSGLVFGGGAEHDGNWSGFYGGKDEAAITKMGANLFAPTYDSAANAYGGSYFFANANGYAPASLGFDHSRTLQITPSWQTRDGDFVGELSFFQGVDYAGGGRYTHGDEVRSINDLGGGSLRLTWKPVDGLKLLASGIIEYNNVDGLPAVLLNGSYVPGDLDYTDRLASSTHGAVNLHASWQPAFLPALKLWAMWMHEWNAGFLDDMDADIYQAGLSYGLNEKLRVYGFGEYMRHKWGKAHLDVTPNSFRKSDAWALQIGGKYIVGYGVSFDLGYRYENFKYKGDAGKHTEATLHAGHARLNFEF